MKDKASIITLCRNASLAFVFAWFMLGGIGHFVNTDFFVSIMPGWIPVQFYLPLIYVSGLIEILLATVLLLRRFRPGAGWGLILVTIGVTPANIHMWLHPELFPDIPPALLSIRLVIQVLLILLIWWASRTQTDQRISAA